MSRAELERSAVDLAWSLWTELGVPGVIRNHGGTVVDPEPLIVASPAIMALDLRLRDQVYRWCAAHADRISVSRLRGLVSGLNDFGRLPFWSFTATLRRASVRWPTDESAPPWQRAPEAKPPALPTTRPGLLRMRLRTLCGVGARSDVVCELLAREGTWLMAAELGHEGYTKRGVSRILAELAESGLVKKRSERNALQYQLARPDALRTLVCSNDLAFPRWTRIFVLVLTLLELVARSGSSPSVRRVEAHKLRAAVLEQVGAHLGLEPPPPTRGASDAWEAVLDWGERRVSELAAGTSRALSIGA